MPFLSQRWRRRPGGFLLLMEPPLKTCPELWCVSQYCFSSVVFFLQKARREDTLRDGKETRTSLMMTDVEVALRVADIRVSVSKGFYGIAHVDESNLMEAVLKEIAEGAPNASVLASEAVKSLEIKFPRGFSS